MRAGATDRSGHLTVCSCTSFLLDLGLRGVVFNDATALQTTATFPGPGTYLLRLTADDGAIVISSDVTITVVNDPPQVSAGSPQTLTLPDVAATLAGSASDDGQPDPPGLLTTLWSHESGPAGVVFSDATDPQTTVTFPGPGTYVLRITADDGAASVSSDVTITVVDPAGNPVTVESRVSASSDDAEQKLSGSMKLSSSDLEMTFDKTDQIVGMRFLGLGIPPSVTITSTWLQFEVDEVNTAPAALEIRGELHADAPAFLGTSGNIDARTKTSAVVLWPAAAWENKNDAGPAQRTPDLSPVIQQIVNEQGWSASSALVLFVEGSGKRVAESFDGESAAAPLLHLEYLAGGS